MRGPFTLPSEAYPGTQHTYWVYVPAQYSAKVPASLMILNDGQAFKNMDGDVRAPNVLDNLIYRREIPVIIAAFINPGRRPDQPEPTPQNWGDRDTNRPAEYNTLDDKYAYSYPNSYSHPPIANQHSHPDRNYHYHPNTSLVCTGT